MNDSGLEPDGFTVLSPSLPGETIDRLEQDYDRLRGESALDSSRAVRNVLARSDAVRAVAGELNGLASTLLGASCQASKATYFDKSLESNWLVSWHQDLTVTVSQRIDEAGFAHWRLKDDAWHVQPPVGVLSRTVALRLHIDDCPRSLGPLRVLPATHRAGVLGPEEIDALARSRDPVVLSVGRGTIVAMSPLLLHASSKATSSGHRRVLHLEFSSAALPAPLRWHV